MIVATALFAAMGACVKLASADYGTFEIVSYRAGVGVLTIGVWALWTGRTLKTQHRRDHALRASVGVTSLALWFYAIGHLPLPTAMTLNYTSPLFIAAIAVGAAALGHSHRVDLRLLATIGIGFLGVLIMLQPSMTSSQTVPAAIGLLSGAISALAYMMVRRLGQLGEPEWRTVFYFSLAGLLVGVLGTSLFGTAHQPDGRGLLLLTSVGVLATLAQLAMTRAFGRGKTMLSASLQYLGIVHSSLIGLVFFDDHPPLSSYLGIAMIVGGGVIATTLTARQPARRDAPQGATPA